VPFVNVFGKEQSSRVSEHMFYSNYLLSSFSCVGRRRKKPAPDSENLLVLLWKSQKGRDAFGNGGYF